MYAVMMYTLHTIQPLCFYPLFTQIHCHCLAVERIQKMFLVLQTYIGHCPFPQLMYNLYIFKVTSLEGDSMNNIVKTL